jgi:hypothetical protein
MSHEAQHQTQKELHVMQYTVRRQYEGDLEQTCPAGLVMGCTSPR